MKKFGKVLSVFLALLMVIGMIPITSLTVFAGHTCEECQDWIDGEPYCSECYRCQGCIDLCIECGVCTECSGNEICEGCSDEETGAIICNECAIDKGSHCPDCYGCYLVSQSWCAECGTCEDCKDMCDPCSVNLGKGLLCEDCAAEGEGHCQECGGCYFEIQNWCEECMQCAECVEICEYCSTEEGKIICVECSISEGLHCPDCSECYGDYGGDRCEECYICAGCRDICSTHDMCIDCTIDQGLHCPDCEACGEDETICEDCGEVCSACSVQMCEDCNLCDECVEICPDCGACSNCADICENCYEHCSDCEGICDDCGLCLVCCEDFANFAGCDCSDWICVDNDEWNEHFDENHTEPLDGHYARPASAWSWDNTYHWHECVYCDDSNHYTGKNAHTYDAYDTCTVCGHIKNSDIMILEHPKDSKGVYVTSPDEDYDESNIAHFMVKAVGNSKLTYTWCRRYYVNGQITYKPLEECWDIQPGEDIDGPDIYIVVPTDACCDPLYICCIITDEEGHQVRTEEALLTARHNYQYYEMWKTHEWPFRTASRNNYGHILQCVGECCDEKQSGLRPHEDKNNDKLCDICDYEITGILVTKQPKDCKSAYVCSADEKYDESNIAHFSVEAYGDSELTYTWYRKQYVNGKLQYVQLKNPEDCENYDGPNLDIIVPTDACCVEYTYCCFITDEEGNEVRTVDVVLKAKHNYQYFKDYLSTRKDAYGGLLRLPTGHFLQCVGEGCGKTTRLRRHEEANNDFTCDICNYRSVVDLVELTVTAPKEGQKPSYTVKCASPAYYAYGKMNNGNYWYVSDNGVDNWKLIDNTHTFVAGKYYKFSVDLCTANGYRFDKHQNYNSKVLVKINGGPGFYATKTYNKEFDNYITAEYVFGECNDSVIENIVIDGVTEPVAGQRPTYEATVRGNGYYIRNDYNRYEDDYMSWNIPEDEREYYIVNGIGWFDLTSSDWVHSNETFIPGHQYQINVYINTEDGYTFWHDKWNDMLFTASVNGTGAEGNTSSNLGLTTQNIMAPFICQPQDVSEVILYYLNAPQAGRTPDYDLIVAQPDIYQLDANYAGSNGIIWYDSEGNQLEPTDTFVEGKQYKVEIKIIPAKIDGANVCRFVSPTTVYLNGNEVVERLDWDMVYASANALYVYYTFEQGATPPSPKKSVSGQISSYGSNTEPITVQLIPQGFPEPAYETIVYGTQVEYCFDDVPSGSYILKVTKNDVGTKSFWVTVNNASVIQHVTFICTNHVYDNKDDNDCNKCGAVRDYAWGVGVNATGVYNITPNKTLNGFTKDSITVYDKNLKEVKYNNSKKGWPLVALQNYSIKLNAEFNNTNDLSWNLTKVADTIFPDTSKGAWYSDAVTYAVGAGIMSGYNNGKFGTSDSIQRQDFLVMLARLEGVDLDSYGAKKSAFPDVPEGSYFEAAVNWGSENKIVTGYDSGKFGVGDKVTREQLVTFLYRYAKYKGYDTSYTNDRETIVSGQYKDFKKVSGFAKQPILWAIEKGVISGKTATTIVPQGNAQRCEVAKIMYNIFLNDIFV